MTSIPDTTSPEINNVHATAITNDSAIIDWDTDELSDSLVKYGTESGNYTLNVSDAAFVTSHSITLTELLSNTTYYYVVNSTDPGGNTKESMEYSFATVNSTNTASSAITNATAVENSEGDYENHALDAYNSTKETTYGLIAGVKGTFATLASQLKSSFSTEGYLPRLNFREVIPTASASPVFVGHNPLDVNESFNKGLNWTKSVQNADKSWGFKIEPRDTATSTYILNKTTDYDLSEEISSLERFKNADSLYGKKDVYETTYYVLGTKYDNSTRDFILSSQSQDGSWNNNVEDTCFALLSLKGSGYNDAISNGVQWLLLTMNSDNGFGYSGDESYPLYTAQAALVFKAFGYSQEYNKTCGWLVNHVYPDGSWKYPRDTAYAVLALAGSDYNISKSITYLKANSDGDPYIRALIVQALSATNIDVTKEASELYSIEKTETRSWGVVTDEDKIITTSEAVDLFTAINETEYFNSGAEYLNNTSPISLQGLEYMSNALKNESIIQKLLSYQKKDGGFGEPYYAGNVKDTCLAYIALYNTSHELEKDAALSYISNSQKHDGSFDTIEETALAILAMKLSENNSLNQKINHAIDYILSYQNPDGSWSNSKQTALCLKALLVVDNETYADNATKAVSYLITNQNIDGSWNNLLHYQDVSTTITILKSFTLVAPGITPLTTSITSPANNSTFVYKQPINFTSSTSGGTIPYTYNWTSSRDSLIGNSSAFNISNLSYGTHKITLTVTDNVGLIDTDEILIIIAPEIYKNTSVNATANMTTTINAANETDTLLDIYTHESVSNATITISKYLDKPPKTGAMAIPSLKYIDIDVSENLDAVIAWVIIKVTYTDEEITAAGIDESTLSFYWWNDTASQWITCDPSSDWVNSAGVDTVKNYVWANVTHLSIYAIGGRAPVVDTTPPLVTNPTATPSSIVADGIHESQLNVTVTDESGIARVTVDLSDIGGSPAQEMIAIPGTDVYTVNTTAAAGTAPDTYELQVNATDNYGNANTSVSIVLTVIEAVDTISPTIESVTLDAYTTIPDATIHVTVNATDNVGVTAVTADGVALFESESIWEGNITAPSATGSYTLTIRAEDAAKNIAEATIDYSVVKPSGSIGIGVDPRLTTVSAGDTALITIKLVSTENFDDVAYVYLTTEGVYTGYEANLTWFNWTSKYVKVPAGGEVNVPLEVSIPAGESGYKMFYAKLESTKWTPTAMDTGVVNIT